jgi:hypothetical protein
MNPFKKICTDDLELLVSDGKITFSYVFAEKQEKEKNLAAGRIHRKITAGVGSWSLDGNVLSVSYDFRKSEILNQEIAFRDIAGLFEEMVKA